VRQHYDPEKDNEPTMYAPGVFPEGYLEKYRERIPAPERWEATSERPKPWYQIL
jgi:hypothetical protein